MSIFIIDNNKERRQNLDLLLDFIDYEIYDSVSAENWKEAVQDNEPEVVLIGEVGDTQETVDLITEIKQA
ncbi:MAG: hypothetical protein PVG20_07925, partial [Thioalkalispiraceae bacterium]